MLFSFKSTKTGKKVKIISLLVPDYKQKGMSYVEDFLSANAQTHIHTDIIVTNSGMLTKKKNNQNQLRSR